MLSVWAFDRPSNKRILPRPDCEHADVTEYELDPSTGQMAEMKEAAAADSSGLTLDPCTGLMITELPTDTVDTNKCRDHGSGQNVSVKMSKFNGQGGQENGALTPQDLNRAKKTTQPGNGVSSNSAHRKQHNVAGRKEVESFNGYEQKEGKNTNHPLEDKSSVRQTGLRVVGSIIDELIARTEAIGEASYHRRRRLSMLTGR